MKLEDKSVIVTGASSGIGEAIAAGFAREGARVVTWGRNLDKLTKAKHRAGKASERLLPRLVDVADQDAVQIATTEAVETLGGLDILVNNAGINVAKRALNELSTADFNSILQVNLNGVFYCIHAVLPHMRLCRAGLIITISSVAGVRASVLGGAAYSASKFGASALSQMVGIEEAENGIRSCLICPGEVNTPILDDRPIRPTPEACAEMLQPEDLAQAALFLAMLPPRATVPEMVITPSTHKYC
tara:strand:- start:794 stop:1528 length:735 start_codon:yes stop_codon:yes gene_type:complete